MKVGELCSRNVVSTTAGAPLLEAVRLMRDQRVGAVAVTAAPAGAGRVIGILTDRDIVLTQLKRAADLAQFSVADAMTADPLLLHEEEPVDTAIRRMHDYRVRRAPVIDASGRLTGLVSFDDLLAHIAATLTALAHLTSRQSPSAEPIGYQI